MNLAPNKRNDSVKPIQNRIKIWPMLTITKQKAKSVLSFIKKPDKPVQDPIKVIKTASNPLPPLTNVRSSFLVEQIFNDKPLDFLDVSTFCTKIKELNCKNSQSSNVLGLKSISETDDFKRSAKLSDLNGFIKICEIEKNYSKKHAAGVIKGVEGIQDQMAQVVGLVQKMTKRPNLVPVKKKKENDCYFTRVQIKKLINELRACTKHIN